MMCLGVIANPGAKVGHVARVGHGTTTLPLCTAAVARAATVQAITWTWDHFPYKNNQQEQVLIVDAARQQGDQGRALNWRNVAATPVVYLCMVRYPLELRASASCIGYRLKASAI